MVNKQRKVNQKKQAKHGVSITTNIVPTVTTKPSTITTKASPETNAISVNGIRMDAEMARNAIIMSEIIGPPKAKRRRGRCY